MADKQDPPVITNQPITKPEALASETELHELINPQIEDLGQVDPKKLDQQEVKQKAGECCSGDGIEGCLELCIESLRCTILHNCFSVPWCNNGCCDDGCCAADCCCDGCCADGCCDGDCCSGCLEACCDDGCCSNCLEACFSCGVCVDI